MNPNEFVAKWKPAELKERSAAQEHWIDICNLLGQKTPAAADPTGEVYCFERGAEKTDGGDGWADVWFKDRFAVEYKRKRRNLEEAYKQLNQYRESLGNPPLLIVIDLDRFEVHTNFTGTAKRIFKFNLDDIASGKPVLCQCNEASPPQHSAIQVLRYAFTDPAILKPTLTAAFVTQQASSGFAKIAQSMRDRGINPRDAAHFLMKSLFCLFAEDIRLLPEKVFERIVKNAKWDPARLAKSMKTLFATMREGGDFGADNIPWFNGGLFEDDLVIELTETELKDLTEASNLNWSQVEPSIFGTLFERSLDPNQRAQLGAHYTDPEDIKLVVEPVVLRPVRRMWQDAREKAGPLVLEARKAIETLEQIKSKGGERTKWEKKLRAARAGVEDIYGELLHALHNLRILDPACGSGNFLYVALTELKTIEKQIILETNELGIGAKRFMPAVEPAQLFGIEVNPYAHELAQVVVWIGYIQWYDRNGSEVNREPVLKPLNNIKCMDALLEWRDGKPVARRPEWPAADFIIGNPPFLGGKLLRTNLGDEYVDTLFKAYDGDVAREADLSVYWHERARSLIEQGRVKRAGLLATQGIRGGANQKTLKRILETGNIFEAWSDREWILAGANVHVSIVCQDRGTEEEYRLDGSSSPRIFADLTGGDGADLSSAIRLIENANLAFQGVSKVGEFDLSLAAAKEMLAKTGNPNERPNSDVIVPYINAMDVMDHDRHYMIIDFGPYAKMEDAAKYEAPFEHVRSKVKPVRLPVRRDVHRELWWLHGWARPEMRAAVAKLRRFVVTPRISKHRAFVWRANPALPSDATAVIAREDDYFFGVLHSVAHERWALALGTQLEDRPRYTPTTSFETFPFPWPPGKEPASDPRVQAIAQAAKELNELRENWLKAPGLSPEEAKKRTLTNLYNARPEWLHLAHLKLDRAVFAAYGWQGLDPANLYASHRPNPGETREQAAVRQRAAEEDMLGRLLKLNLERASG